MFGIRCVVADRNLGEALKALKGLTLEQPIVEPVDDMPRNETYREPKTLNGVAPPKKRANKKGPKPGSRQSGPRNMRPGGAGQVIRDYIATLPPEQKSITSAEVIAACKAKGYRPGSHSHGVALLMADKTLSRADFGVYNITSRAGA